VTHFVDLALLSRRELENLLLTEHGALARVLTAIRSATELQWNVRREVERIIEEAVDRRPFVFAYTRATEADLGRNRASRNAVRWSRWSGADA